MIRTDIAIVGAGIAGAGVAAALGRNARVVLLEAEAQPGYHATGRSAAFWQETYGGPGVQPLTSASGPWLAEHGLLRARGALHIEDDPARTALAALEAEFGREVVLRTLGRDALEAVVPGLKPTWRNGVAEPSTADIDVAALHAHYLAEARGAGTTLRCDFEVAEISRAGRGWRIRSRTDEVEAAILVDAAGAWADALAIRAGAAPLGIQPYRRTMIQLRVSPLPPDDMPLVIDAAGRFYFKPEAGGRLWLSPHDETASDPCDAAPDELDIARAIDRLEQVVDWRVEHVERAWAGLRSFAPDRLPVYGFDPLVPDFFWCAGQGGFGIQTSPAASRLAADLLLGRIPSGVAAGIDPERYAPGRFGT